MRHNIDVMHVEKNVSDAMLSTVMQNAKSKDGLKARKNLEDMEYVGTCIQNHEGRKRICLQRLIGCQKKRKKIMLEIIQGQRP